MFGGNAFAWPRFADWFVTPPPTPVIPKRAQGGSGLYARRHGLPLLPEGVGVPLNVGTVVATVITRRIDGVGGVYDSPTVTPSLGPVEEESPYLDDDDLALVAAMLGFDLVPM